MQVFVHKIAKSKADNRYSEATDEMSPSPQHPMLAHLASVPETLKFGENSSTSKVSSGPHNP